MTLFAVKNAAALAFVYVALISSGCEAHDASGNPRRNGVAANVCSTENKFVCQDGSCIKSELLCDGRADCSDESDETQEACSKPEITCPEYTFRCSYGACVNSDATCNGIRDCLDNSDELLPTCLGVSTTVPELPKIPEGNCAVEDHRCNDGSCINSNLLCDGTIDCADGSDESFETCGSFPCGQIFFRCNYGACIDGDLICNDLINCADGSDEDPLLCRGATSTPSPVTTVPTLSLGTRHFCIVPPQPPNGRRKLHRNHCQNGENCEISEGVLLEPGSQLVYNCNPGFRSTGYPEVSCSYGGQWTRTPVCSQIKCPSPNSVSTFAECIHTNGSWVSCDSAVLPGTRARVICKNGYTSEPNSTISRRTDIQCSATGHWQSNFTKCIPSPPTIYVEIEGGVTRVRAKGSENGPSVNLVDVTSDRVIIYTGQRGDAGIVPNVNVKVGPARLPETQVPRDAGGNPAWL